MVCLAVIGIVYYYARLIYPAVITRQQYSEINYEPKNGEVFKVCPYCNAKVKVSTMTCPRCKRALN